GMTSHDVVARVRRLAQERSVGHLGTLDPSASGVLPLLLGRLTRLAQFFQGRDKEYRGEIRFGFATDTYDAQGAPVGAVVERVPTREEVEALLPRFRGKVQQLPPPYSAKKVAGVPAYKLARRQQPVELAPVEVEVRAFELVDLDGDRMQFRVVASTGTYVRSLAHDLGAALGVGAHLSRLERVRVGEFGLEASHTLEELAARAEAGTLAAALLPATRLLPEFPAVVAPADAVSKLLHGHAANLPEFSRAPRVRVFASDGQLLALARRVAGSLFHPQIVFPLE
ncbi:MAG TPA: tRNA pseudouridine(55) synthase TruB, partial [Terriglobales bacterium]|nr:tRNA pseudouridine(55) synthase TruB [Terriglobales bacterium]